VSAARDKKYATISAFESVVRQLRAERDGLKNQVDTLTHALAAIQEEPKEKLKN